MEKFSNSIVDISYQQTGAATAVNTLGMREMQALAYEARDKRFLLIKAPPASGKSRALMFIALDKLAHHGSIVGYTYNPDMQCLEQRIVKRQSTFDTKNLKVLTLNIKKVYFDEIIAGRKKIEYRELKQSTLNKYTYIDEADGKRYLRRYDALRLYVGYHKDRESALVQVLDTTYSDGIVEYHLGAVLEVLGNSQL